MAALRSSGPGRSLTQEELSHHVNARYTETMRQQQQSDASSTSQETQEYLKELNSRPSLVLNADYQVR